MDMERTQILHMKKKYLLWHDENVAYFEMFKYHLSYIGTNKDGEQGEDAVVIVLTP